MRSLISLAVVCVVALPAAELPYFHVLSKDTGAWPDILESLGMEASPANQAHVLVAPAGSAVVPEWIARVENGTILILEGDSPLARAFGFRPGKDTIRVQSLIDVHNPTLSIIWEKSLELPVFELPDGSRIFARERWTGAPMTAGLKRGSGALLWLAAPPGERGYERFPYLLVALCDLGLAPPFRSARLWAFLDSAYRLRVDLDYFAARWRKAGIAALHVAAWHFYEPDPEADAYLKKLIAACHQQGILVYAWLELPHVSDKFWEDHPEWREKTALLQDAQLDWRKLMNLENRECFRSVSSGIRELIGRFDWDGINLAELYFESLEGIGNPSRFTPMNDDVRAEFRAKKGFDPIHLFGTRNDATSMRAFLDFRRELSGRIQQEWLEVLESIRRAQPELDVVVTHIDDRFDTSMRDALGVDTGEILPLLDRYNFTFLIEDPATIWHLGAQRYRTIAAAYARVTSRTDKLAIDLNIVDRYQDVYPTKQQTGTELFQLIHEASANFRRVALYFENSLLAPDLSLLPSAAAAVTRVERVGTTTIIESRADVGLPWKGAALVDGQLWPAADDETLWLPAGRHRIEAASHPPGARLIWLNGDLEKACTVNASTIQFGYTASGRTIAVLDRKPIRIAIEGVVRIPASDSVTVFLPNGQHVVTITTK